jgi:prepilin peptidase CpaA
VAVETLIVSAFVFLLAYAAVSDTRQLLIPNWISILLLALFLVYVSFSDKPLPVLAHAAVGLLVLLVGFALFLAGWLGAGDVKLLAAVALWAGPERIQEVLLLTTMLGAGLAVAIIALKRCSEWHCHSAITSRLDQFIPHWVHRGLTPYGVAISAAGLAIIPGAVL